MRAPWAALAMLAMLAMCGAAQAADDRIEYRLHCSGCHGVDGRGLPANGIPDLHESGRWAALPSGREYLVQVPGIAASGIDDELAARLLNWTLQTYSAQRLPATFQPFTSEEVRHYRVDIATDAGKRRQSLQQALKAQGR